MKKLPVFALLIMLAGNVALAERTPTRAMPLADDGNARVIVKFKPGASLLRAHALGATSSRSAAASALDGRATVLGARLGLRLRAGPALTDRVQVVQADGVDARTLAARLARDADVEYAEVDRRARRLLVPNDPRFASVATGVGRGGPAVGQWYLRAPAGEVASSIDAVSAWDTTSGSANVVVAVLDTGVRFDHPDLAGKLLAGYDMVSDAAISNDGDGRDGDPSDPGDWVTAADITTPTFAGCDVSSSSWHGTQVSGIIGAATDNGVGMAGAGWNVRVLPVRVLGKCFGYTSDIVTAIRWAAGIAVPGLPANPNPARVINLSLGSSGACSTEERNAIKEANDAGAVVVVAAGNTAGLAANSPANCPGAIGVAALRHVGTKVGFSDVGPELSIAAPGGNCINIGPGEPCLYPIITALNAGTTVPVPDSSIYSDSYDAAVGTSFSAPLVAGTVALMLSAQPALTPANVRALLQASARPFPTTGGDNGDATVVPVCQPPTGTDQLQCYCTTDTCGAGMLDARGAVQAALGVLARITYTPVSAVAEAPVTLSAAGSVVAPGRAIASVLWTLVDGGGIVNGFAGAANATTAAVLPSAAGRFTVSVTVTDDLGRSAVASSSIDVTAATVEPPVADASSGGGGALGAGWLLALVVAVLVVWRRLRPGRSPLCHGAGQA